MLHPLSCWEHRSAFTAQSCNWTAKLTYLHSLHHMIASCLKPDFLNPCYGGLQLCWGTAHTLHMQLWPFPTTGRTNITGFQKFQGAAAAVFIHYFHFDKGKTAEDQTEDEGIECLGAYTQHMVQMNLQKTLLLHAGFRLRGQSKMTGSNLEETSFPLPAVQMSGLPETSQTRDLKIKAF